MLQDTTSDIEIEQMSEATNIAHAVGNHTLCTPRPTSPTGSVDTWEVDHSIQHTTDGQSSDLDYIFHSDNASNTSSGSETQSLNIPYVGPTVAITSSINGKRKWDKRQFCLYCSRGVTKLPRHLSRKHVDKPEVKMGLTLPVNSKERRNWFDNIRKRGNFYHNVEVLHSDSGIIVPVRRSKCASDPSDSLPCEVCYGFYSSKELWRHVKACKLKIGNVGTARMAQSRGKMMLLSTLCKEQYPRAFVLNILEKLRPDQVTAVVLSDPNILRFGLEEYECRGQSHLSHQHSYVRSKMRQLARLLQKARDINNSIKSLIQLIDPGQFDVCVKAARAIAGYSAETCTFAIPSYAINVAFSLKRVVMQVKIAALKAGDQGLEKKASDYLSLMDLQWGTQLSKAGHETLAQRKYGKGNTLPLASDVQKLDNYLKSHGDKLSVNLKQNPQVDIWLAFAETVMSKIILFNRRRSGEVENMTIAQTNGPTDHAICTDSLRLLSPFERTLIHKFRRFSVRGKRGRVVPVLITERMSSDIKLLNDTREACGVSPKNECVFSRPYYDSTKALRGCDSLRKMSLSCGASEPARLTSTKLRKHVGTMSQVLNLQDNELDILAGFLGHDIHVHRHYYRLQEETLQVAKVSKILLMLERGKIHQYKGKSLDDITLSSDSETSDIESADELVDDPRANLLDGPMASSATPDSVCVIETKQEVTPRRVVKRQWLADERTIMKKCFAQHLKTGQLPSKYECLRCMQDNRSGINQARKWSSLKQFIRDESRRILKRAISKT